jgi:hypothetical protein
MIRYGLRTWIGDIEVLRLVVVDMLACLLTGSRSAGKCMSRVSLWPRRVEKFLREHAQEASMRVSRRQSVAGRPSGTRPDRAGRAFWSLMVSPETDLIARCARTQTVARAIARVYS